MRAAIAVPILLGDVRLIVPGHDPAVMKKFSKVTENVVRIE